MNTVSTFTIKNGAVSVLFTCASVLTQPPSRRIREAEIEWCSALLNRLLAAARQGGFLETERLDGLLRTGCVSLESLALAHEAMAHAGRQSTDAICAEYGA